MSFNSAIAAMTYGSLQLAAVHRQTKTVEEYLCLFFVYIFAFICIYTTKSEKQQINICRKMAIGSGFPVDRRRIDSPQDIHLDQDTQ